MKTVSIIRDRGQLTIPDAIRKIATWITPMSAVSISIIKPDEIVIKPQVSTIDEEKIWSLIQRSRAIKGNGNSSTVNFLEKDRSSH